MTFQEFQEQWPTGTLVEHKELHWRGRVVANEVFVSEVDYRLDVNFYITEPYPDIKCVTVMPCEIVRIKEKAKEAV